MKKQGHILNGDSLKERFPKKIQEEIIVARECLIDGTVKGSNLVELFDSRAEFISQNYEGFSKKDYFENVVPEFQKIQNISNDTTINLWFEDDLFCQVNLWFVIHLLSNAPYEHQSNSIFLIRPKTHNQYGFGGLNESELISVYENRLLLTQFDKLASLWELYQNDDTKTLLKIAKELESTYPFILPAVEAHIERIPTEGNLGRPSQSIIQIMQELETEEFGPVFREFNKRESIYGFGDLQVKRLFDDIKENHENN